MEKITKKKLKLYFKDAENTQRTVSVDYPQASYKDEDINKAMDEILKSGVLETKKGALTTKANAEMETIEKAPYTITQA